MLRRFESDRHPRDSVRDARVWKSTSPLSEEPGLSLRAEAGPRSDFRDDNAIYFSGESVHRGIVHEAWESEATGRRRIRLIFRSLFFTTPYRQLSPRP